MSVVEIGRSFELLLEKALLLGELGYRVFPLRRHQKEPLFNDWPVDATNDLEQIKRWFDNDDQRNIGLACGPQPNGIDLVAIDIDNKHGVDGKVAWKEIGRTIDLSQLKAAPRHGTPYSGSHIFAGTTETLRNSRSKIGAGIDTRGAGGYVVLPPSRIVDEAGEFRHYTAVQPLWSTPVPVMPGGLQRLLMAPPAPQPASTRAGGRQSGTQASSEDTPFDYARRTYEWETELVAAGWRYLYERGGDSYWSRPGKTDRGHSAVLHQSGAFTVFSTEVPQALENLGRPTPDGTGFTVSIGDFVTAYRFGGDPRAAASEWSRQMRASTTPAGRVAGTDLVESDTDAVEAPPAYSWHLPPEFWEQRPWLAHIKQAAEAKMVAPDALLVSILARYAALVPPCYRLPGIVGSQGTLDFLACVVAETGGGKSAANGVARDLLPNPFLNREHPEESIVLSDLPVGSGEGLVQAFFIDDVDPETNKRTGKQRVGKMAAHFLVDEGAALMSMAKRDGVTILPTLCSAWSGQTLGQMNASAERKRVIAPGRVRVSAVINMQASNAWRLFVEEVTVLGFPGRLILASATNPAAPDPDEIPDWPGQLRVHHHPVVNLQEIELTYDSTIVSEVRRSRFEDLKGSSAGDPLRSQQLLGRCKVAGLVALLEGRLAVTEADWALAGQILNSSNRLLDHLQELRAAALQARDRAQVTRQVGQELTREDLLVERVSNSLLTKIKRSDKIHTKRALARLVTSSETRHRFEPALELLLEQGLVEHDPLDDTIRLLTQS